MTHHEAHLRRLLPQEPLHLRQVRDPGHHDIGLTAAVLFPQQGFAQHDGIVGRDVGAHRQAVHRRRGDDGHLPDAGQGHLQGARDRRGGEGQHVHVGAELLQLLLVLHAEVLLLVHDHEAEVAERHLLGQDGVGAHDHLELAIGQALPGLGGLLGRDHAGQLAHLDRPAGEPLAEGAEVLAGQQGRRADNGHLLAAHGHNERRPQRDLGFAEAHIAADQPVHRLAAGEVGQHVGDGVQLVVRLVVGEAGAELVEQARRRIDLVGALQLPGGGDADQALGHLSQALLRPGLARLPGRAAQTVQLHPLGVRAVAGQQVDVLHRQIELGLAPVLQVEAVMRRAVDVQGPQARIAADAVVDVNHQIARRQGRGFGQEVLRPALASRPGQTVPQDVGFGNHRQAVGDEPVIHRQDRPLHRLGPGSGDAEGLGVAPVGGQAHGAQPVIAEHGGQPVRRSVRPRGEQHPLAVAAQRLGVLGHRLEQVHAVLGPLGGETAPRSRAQVHHGGRGLLDKGAEHPDRMLGQAEVPGLMVQIKPRHRQGAIDRPAPDLRRLAPGVIGVGDHRQPLVPGVGGLMVHQHQGAGTQIVEQGFRRLVEEGQVMLHAAAAAALADGGVERIVRRRAEQGDKAGAEAGDRRLVHQGLAHGQQVDRRELSRGALGHGVKAADRLQGVTEQVQPDRLLGRGRIDVDHPAADGELPALRHGGGADIAVDREIPLQVADRDIVPDPGGKRRPADCLTGGQTLDDAGRRRHHQSRRGARARGRAKPRQGGHAAGGHTGAGADAVIGQAVPAGQLHHFDPGIEEAHRVGEGAGPGGVAGDEHAHAPMGPGQLGRGKGVKPLRRAGEGQAAGQARQPRHVRGRVQGFAHGIALSRRDRSGSGGRRTGMP